MNLHEHVHSERCGSAFELGGTSVIDRSHDDEDAIGPGGARFEHLVRIVHEVLAEGRQRAGLACDTQMLKRTLKRGRVGQHRKARSAAGLIGGGQSRGIEIRADEAARRARLLYFGNQRVAAGVEALLDRRQEAARRAGGMGGLLESADRPGALCRGDLFALIGRDLGEDVSHRSKL